MGQRKNEAIIYRFIYIYMAIKNFQLCKDGKK